MKILVPVAAALVVAWLRFHGKIAGRLCLAGMIGLAVCLALTVVDVRDGERTQIRMLDKNSRENAGEEVELEAETADGTRHEVKLRIPDRTEEPEEADRMLRETAAGLEKTFLGKNRDPDHVEWNLCLPVSFEDSEVNCIWSSDHPEILGWDGKILGGVPAKGQAVRLTARLELRDRNLTWEKMIRIYPSREEEAFQEKVQEAAEQINRNRKRWSLPEQLDGEPLVWYRQRGGKGEILSALILILVLGSVSVRKSRKEEREQKYREELTRRYPEIVSQLQLYTAAGLSLRQAMKKIARIQPEAARCCYEMENGVLEQDAYTRYGERCGTAEYKKLALLLAQSQMKGGARLSELLEEETQEAFENRKRRARVLGEKAAVRMILPMGLMLLIVLVIIMVPALLTF